MIRKLLLTIAAAAIAISASAEVHYKPHVSIGAHGGATLSKIAFSPSVKQGFGQGFTGGLSVRYAEERLVGVVGEFNIAQRGWAEVFEESPLSYHRTITYVSLPVMTHIYFGPPRFKCFFNLGPEFGYMLGESTSANFDYHDPTHAEGWPSEVRMTEQMVMPVKNKFDYGICVGFGCEFWLKPRHSIYVEARYYYGLGNIFPATKADTFAASRNTTIAVTMGYNFRIK